MLRHGQCLAVSTAAKQDLAQAVPTRAIARHLARHLPPFLLGPRQVSHLGVDHGQVLPRLEAGQPTVDAAEMPLIRIDQNALVGARRLLQPAQLVQKDSLPKSQLHVLSEQLPTAPACRQCFFPAPLPHLSVNQKGIGLSQVRLLGED